MTPGGNGYIKAAMPKKPQKDVKQKIIETALKLAAEQGWENTSLADIAKACKLSLAKLHDQFEDKADIIAGLGRMIDKKVLENAGKPDPKTPPRELLFDILMERYDVLNQYRTGIVSILDSFKCDPKQAVIALPHLCKSMTWMLEAAGLNTSGVSGALRVAGLTAVYAKNLYTWKDDDSADLAKTMAALDKDLERAEQLANLLGL
jgi:AcrR family transcriptional regulator